jgi:hypothetical protein
VVDNGLAWSCTNGRVKHPFKKSVSQAKFDQSYSIITVFICRGFLPWKVYLLQAQEKWSCNGWSLPRRTASMKPKSCCLPSFSLWRDTVAYGNGSPSFCSLWIHWRHLVLAVQSIPNVPFQKTMCPFTHLGCSIQTHFSLSALTCMKNFQKNFAVFG